jgi:isocitrate dehydrogenase
MTLDKARDVKMELVTKSGKTIVLKPKVSLLAGEIIDSMFMSKKALCEFYEEQLEDAAKTGVMFSLHVKATMMKVSHPIVFGHCVQDLLQGSLREARQAVRGTGGQRQ